MAAYEPSPDAVDLATRAWLTAMRRLYLRRHGSKRACPILPFDDYGPEDRAVMARAVKAALVAGHPDNVEATLAALEDQSE